MARAPRRRTPVAVPATKPTLLRSKAVISHRTALQVKYGPKGLARITAALQALVTADSARGITTQVFFIDDATTMKGIGAKPVAHVTDEPGTKAAVDAIAKRLPE